MVYGKSTRFSTKISSNSKETPSVSSNAKAKASIARIVSKASNLERESYKSNLNMESTQLPSSNRSFCIVRLDFFLKRSL